MSKVPLPQSDKLTAREEAGPPGSIAWLPAPAPSPTVPAAPGRQARPPKIRIGTSGWHYQSWHGPFYPPAIRAKDFLPYYAGHFDTAEINNSFYRLPTEQAVRAWRESVPDGFLFAWKASRFMTHMKRLKDIGDSITLVFGRMAELGATFGPVLFQLPPTFKAEAETRERLARCLSLIPAGRRCAVEFRHPSWYAEPTFACLRDHNAALCISDHADAPAPWLATSDFVYIRAHGTNGRYAGSYDSATLSGWTAPVARWHAEGRDVYVYFDNDIRSAAPGDARELLRLTRRPA